VAHVFGIFEPEVARPQLTAVRAAGTPVVLTPIWWDRTAFFTMTPHVMRALRERTADRALARFATLRAREESLCRRPGRGALRRRDEQAALMHLSDVAFVGSEIEAFACTNGLGAASVPYVVGHYGASDALSPDSARARSPAAGAPRSGVACIGRIEPLKNQAALLLALRDVDVDVTLLGRCYDPEYRALCERWATPRTRFIERVDRDDVHALLASVAVHVLPSWGDLPGFVSIEAALAGAHVVAGARGSEREYLGPDAQYVDPLDVDGIRRAVQRALGAPARTPGDALERRMTAFTWERNAHAARDAYARALDGAGGAGGRRIVRGDPAAT
jgi:glycosyltransferase involved in cell wall biosynthesis